MLRHFPSLVKEAAINLKKEDPWHLSAVVAFYVLLALPGLLVIILNAAGAYFGEDISDGRLVEGISDIAGDEAANAVQVIIDASSEAKRTFISTMFGIGTMIFGATGAFYHIQVSINKIWGVKPAPNTGLKKLLLDRIISFSFVLVMGMLMLVSFTVTTLISVLNDYIREVLPDFTVYFAYGLNELLSLAAVALFFALTYRYLPDAKIRWKTVWIGAFITAFLFITGKFFLGLYFGRVNPASAFGAAGSIVLIMLWVTYSALIFFFGAEFTCVYARRYGMGVKPKAHAVRVETKEEIVEYGKDA